MSVSQPQKSQFNGSELWHGNWGFKTLPKWLSYAVRLRITLYWDQDQHISICIKKQKKCVNDTFYLTSSIFLIATESKNFFRWNMSKLKLGIFFYLNDICIQLGYCDVKYVLISLVRLLSHLICKTQNPFQVMVVSHHISM